MKMINSALFAATSAVALLAAPASASVITFDDLNLTNGTTPAVANGYAGLNWSNINALDAVTYGAQGANGYTSGLVSSRNVAFVLDSSIGQISAAAPFTFNGGYFTAAWNNAMTLTIRGLVGGVQTYADSFTINQAAPTQRSYNWTGLTSVTFQASGGVDAGTFGSGNHVAIDNLAINTPAVPEPASWAMMILGMGAVGFAMRRRTGNVKTTVAYAA